MKLDFDCIRDLLLVLEKRLVISDSLEQPSVTLDQLHSERDLHNYSFAELIYTADKLCDAGFIDATVLTSDTHYHGVVFYSITFSGHQYLDNVRSSQLWKKIKDTAFEKGLSLSLDYLPMIATYVVKALLQ